MISHKVFIEERQKILGSLATILGEVTNLREKEFDSSIDYNYIKRLEEKLDKLIFNDL